MRISRRSRKGQSMIEYGIGIGCVAAVCMVAMGGLGKASFDIMNATLQSINDKNDQVQDAGNGIFTQGPSSATPWVLK